MTPDSVDDRLRLYLQWLRGYVEVTRGVFEDTALLTQNTKTYVSLLLMVLDQTEDAYTEALGEEERTEDVDEDKDALTPESPLTLPKELQERADREADAFHRSVISILTKERALLDDTVATLLDEHIVVINRPEGVIRIRLIGGDIEHGVVHLEHMGWDGGSGTTQIPLAEIPESERSDSVRRSLTVCLANMSETS